MIISQINWNPSPELVKIGAFAIRYYSLMFVIAFIGGLQLMKRIYLKDKISSEKLDSLFIYVVVSTLIGARIGHFLFYDPQFLIEKPLEVILPFRFSPEFEFTGFAGLASHGAAIGIIIAMYFYAKKVLKKPLLYIIDRLTVPVAFGAIFVRLGNLMNSEIVGKVTGSDFGFRFIRSDIGPGEAMGLTNTKSAEVAYDLIASNRNYAEILNQVPLRHPAQLYEALSYVLIFIIMFLVYWKTNKKEKLGYMFGLFFVLLWSARFVIEFFKEVQVDERATWALNTGQWLSIPLVLIGLYIMFRKRK